MTESYVVPSLSEGKPIVFMKGNAVYTDSRTVAERSGKRHDNILRAIDELIKASPRAALNFEGSDYLDKSGRKLRSFHMTRDGFTLLAMGFTGKEWVEWRLDYIQAFNLMEEELRRRGVIPNFEDPEEACVAWLAEHRAKKAAEAQVAILGPKAGVYDRIAGTTDEHSRKAAAQFLQMREKELTEWLRDNRWIQRDAKGNWVLYADIRNKRFAVLKMEFVHNIGTTVPVIYLTNRGIAEIGMTLWHDEPQRYMPLLAELGFDRKLLGAPR